jgi:hypothetical protein
MLDHPRKMALQMRIIRVKPLSYEMGVVSVFRKNDCLAKPIAFFDLYAVRHQMFKHLVDRVGIEQPFIDGGGVDAFGNIAILCPFQSVPRFFFLV